MNKNFSKWFLETWEKTNGIICQADAAALLGITRQTILSRIKTGSIKSYEYHYQENEKEKKKVYVSLNEIAKLKLKKG